ncbi:protein SMG9 [Drosophila nasuta]|uniref:protein SMG9 n=1 Tax=Drosophila nasuta TaxID=42062 RepID=UPI00295EA8BF|nr:protein SMG9 [Drosophila nasuta]
MAETRRRFRNKKRDDGRQGGAPSTPVTIARREDARNALVQPKILLKKETESNNSNTGSSSSNNEPQLLTGSTSAIKTIIINRSSDATRHSSERGMPTATTSASVCAALTTASNKEKPQGGAGSTSGAASTAAAAGQDGMLGPPRMTRPTTLLMSNGAFNVNARKLFHKTNTDFTVIGVLGAQSVGKSTLLNLLSAERDANYDYYGHLFAADADECIFSTRHRSKTQQQQSQQQPQQQQQQSKSRRTESLQFFITRERFVLLDSVSFGKEAEEQQELPTLSLIMQLLSVCHVLLLAVDELSLEQARLLQTALRLRPRSPIKSYVPGHLPQLMFVRTRAQRQHFEPAWRECFDRQLTLLFEASGLPMHRGRGEARVINSFVLPLVRSNAATCHHPELFELVREFRERVLTMQRISMCPSHDFSESLWFDLMAETTRKCNSDSQHFESIFGDIKHRHFESLCSKSWRNNEGVASVSASASNSWRNDA